MKNKTITAKKILLIGAILLIAGAAVCLSFAVPTQQTMTANAATVGATIPHGLTGVNAVIADGNTIYFSSTSRPSKFMKYDTVSGAVTEISGLAEYNIIRNFTQDENYLYLYWSGGGSSGLKKMDKNTGLISTVSSLPSFSEIIDCGTHYYFTNLVFGNELVWQFASYNKSTHETTVLQSAETMFHIAQDGDKILVSNGNTSVKVFDTAAQEFVNEIAHPIGEHYNNSISDMAADAQYIYFSGSTGGFMRLSKYNKVSGELTQLDAKSVRIEKLLIDGNTIYGVGDNRLLIYDKTTDTGERVDLPAGRFTHIAKANDIIVMLGNNGIVTYNTTAQQEFTVNYYDENNNLIKSEQVANGGYGSAPALPQDTEYDTFSWNYDTAMPITQNVDFRIIKTTETHTVTLLLYVSSNEIGTLNIPHGTVLDNTTLVSLIRNSPDTMLNYYADSYDYLRLFTDRTENGYAFIQDGNVITEDVTYSLFYHNTAEPIAVSFMGYNFETSEMETVYTETVTVGECLTSVPEIPAWAQYEDTVAHWEGSSDGMPYTTDRPIYRSMSFYVTLVEITRPVYTVTWYDFDGNVLNIGGAAGDSGIPYREQVKEGEFARLHKNENATEFLKFLTPENDDVLYSIVWSFDPRTTAVMGDTDIHPTKVYDKFFTVNFVHPNGTILETQSIQGGKFLTMPDIVIDGKTVIDWKGTRPLTETYETTEQALSYTEDYEYRNEHGIYFDIDFTTPIYSECTFYLYAKMVDITTGEYGEQFLLKAIPVNHGETVIQSNPNFSQADLDLPPHTEDLDYHWEAAMYLFTEQVVTDDTNWFTVILKGETLNVNLYYYQDGENVLYKTVAVEYGHELIETLYLDFVDGFEYKHLGWQSAPQYNPTINATAEPLVITENGNAYAVIKQCRIDVKVSYYSVERLYYTKEKKFLWIIPIGTEYKFADFIVYRTDTINVSVDREPNFDMYIGKGLYDIYRYNSVSGFEFTGWKQKYRDDMLPFYTSHYEAQYTIPQIEVNYYSANNALVETRNIDPVFVPIIEVQNNIDWLDGFVKYFEDVIVKWDFVELIDDVDARGQARELVKHLSDRYKENEFEVLFMTAQPDVRIEAAYGLFKSSAAAVTSSTFRYLMGRSSTNDYVYYADLSGVHITGIRSDLRVTYDSGIDKTFNFLGGFIENIGAFFGDLVGGSGIWWIVGIVLLVLCAPVLLPLLISIIKLLLNLLLMPIKWLVKKMGG